MRRKERGKEKRWQKAVMSLRLSRRCPTPYCLRVEFPAVSDVYNIAECSRCTVRDIQGTYSRGQWHDVQSLL